MELKQQQNESDHEFETRVCKDFIDKSVKSLEKGDSVRVSGGYITHRRVNGILDSNCRILVSKLHSLGYDSTTNHGFGCYDWRFTKKIEL